MNQTVIKENKEKIVYLFGNILEIEYTHSNGSGTLLIDAGDMPAELRKKIEDCDNDTIFNQIDNYLSKSYTDPMAMEIQFSRGEPMGNGHIWKEIFRCDETLANANIFYFIKHSLISLLNAI